MKNVIGYVRVSTDGQVGDDKFGIPVQKEEITRYCEENDLNLLEWVIDDGYSGAKIDRPGLSYLLSGEITNPPIAAIVIAKTDRLARNTELYFFIKYNLVKTGVEVWNVQNDYSQFGAMGNVMESMIVAFAELERDMIKTRTSNGRKLKANNGGYAGGKPPIGYDIDKGNFVINKEEAETVRLILNSETSLRVLAEYLNLNNIKTKSGAKWYAAQIGYIKNHRKLYEGMYKYGDMDWREGTHDAII